MLVTIKGKWCAFTCLNIWLFIIILLLLFWNNLGHSIQIFGWSYNYDTWPNVSMPHGVIIIIININIRLVGN
jgi:hypothetical protein